MISQILIVMIAAIAVAIYAEHRNIQPPLLLALVGVAVSFIPGVPRLELDPEIILTIVVPPLLFSATSDFSLETFVKRLGSIVNLGVLQILVTTAVVGAVTAALMPALTLPVALLLAAVVSPPDAVTAVAVGRKLKLPGRLMSVLKGENLINDAAALTLFTFLSARVTGADLFISNVLLYLAYNAVVGIIVGIVLGMIVRRVRSRMDNPSLITVLTVLVPFTAFLIAQELGASGVLAVVAAGFSLGHTSTGAGYAARLQERQFWRTADALLEAFIFAYIGLQMRFVLGDALAAGYSLPMLVTMSLAVLLAVILVRFGWVFLTAALSHWRARIRDKKGAKPRPERQERRKTGKAAKVRGDTRRGGFEPQKPFTWQENLVIAWTGMRGVVTLAAAAGIPLVTLAGDDIPGRAVVQVIAFTVAIGTLLLQGLTLPWLIGVLKISDPAEAVYRAEQRRKAGEIGKAAAIGAAVAFRDQQNEPAARAAADLMLERVLDENGVERQFRIGHGDLLLAFGEKVLHARREALIAARDKRQLDDEVVRELIEAMDLQEAALTNWQPLR